MSQTKNVIETARRLYRNRYAGKKIPVTVGCPSKYANTLTNLKEGGIAIIENYFTREQCQEICQAIDKVFDKKTDDFLRENRVNQPNNGWETEYGYRIWADKNFSDKRIPKSEKIHPLIKIFFDDDDLWTLGKVFLGFEFNKNNCQAGRTIFMQNNLGSGGGWHRDQSYRRGYKAMAYLTDVNEDNGPFQYIKNSSDLSHHLLKTPFPDKYQYTEEEIMKIIDGNSMKITTNTAKAGTVIVFDTNAIHRGKPLNQGTRYALTNYYN